MSVESLEQVDKLWKTKRITEEQVIGKILLLLGQYYVRLLKLETAQRRSDKGR